MSSTCLRVGPNQEPISILTPADKAWVHLLLLEGGFLVLTSCSNAPVVRADCVSHISDLHILTEIKD